MASIPVCPLLSSNANPDSAYALCVQEDCALYLPPAKKCSLVYLGYQAMLEVQKLQGGQAPKAPQKAQ
ncbi:MAG: hypothetical protein AB7P76_12325 [Candidatus Melainabacteria bacterium]